MSDYLSLSRIFVDVAICVVTHGVFIGTGFEDYLGEVFGAESHLH